MNFSLGVSVSGNGDVVIRNGGQVIKVKSNYAQSGRQNIQMNSVGISINQNGQEIRMNGDGIFISNDSDTYLDASNRRRPPFATNRNAIRFEEEDISWDTEEEQDSFDYESGFTGRAGPRITNYYQNDEEEEDLDDFDEANVYENDELSYDERMAEEMDEEEGYFPNPGGFQTVFSANFRFNQPGYYFQPQDEFFGGIEEEKEPEEPKLTKKQIDKLPVSVFTLRRPESRSKVVFPTKGKTPIHQLKSTQSQTAVAQPSSHETCAVCIVDYKIGDLQRTLKCNHKFHKDCIDKWLLIKNACPVCKTKAIEI